jgi:hypothetical protein
MQIPGHGNTYLWYADKRNEKTRPAKQTLAAQRKTHILRHMLALQAQHRMAAHRQQSSGNADW